MAKLCNFLLHLGLNRIESLCITSVQFKCLLKYSLQNIIRQQLRVLRPKERKRFTLLALGNILYSLADVLILILLLFVVAAYAGSSARLSGLFPKWETLSDSVWPAAFLLVLFLIKNISGYFLFSYQSHSFFKIASRLSLQGLSDFFAADYYTYVQSERANVFNRINYRPIEFAQNVLSSIQTIVSELSVVGIATLAILFFKPILFLLLLLFLLPPVIVSSLMVRKKIRKVKQEMNYDMERTVQYLNESFSSFIEANMYRNFRFFEKRYMRFQQNLSAHVSALQISQWMPARLVEIFVVLGLFMIILIDKWTGYHSSAVDIGAFIAAAYKIMPGIIRSTNAMALLKAYEHVVKDLSSFGESGFPQEEPSVPLHTMDFEGVNFSYPYQSKLILENFSYHISKGDFVFVHGVSGRGKSTFLHLLLGFLSPAKGDIRLNGYIADNATFLQYRSRFAYLKQQALILQDSVEVNITLADRAETDQARLKSAVALSGLSTVLDNLPEGIRTVLADEGKDLSGGQKQRIALARALYRNTDVLILDEPFSELDKGAEQALLQTLQDLAKNGKTIILVSHNPLCASYCSKELVL